MSRSPRIRPLSQSDLLLALGRNGGLARRALRPLLLALAILGLLGQSVGAVAAGWTCEGKVCSTSLSSCCCVQQASGGDGFCRSRVVKAKACTGKCDCKLQVQSSRLPSTAEFKHSTLPLDPLGDLPAVLPPEFELPTAPLFAYAPAFAKPPPPWEPSPLDEGAPLRAPPVVPV